ncbi:MAG: hypothetical protein KC414_13925, partial [Romboutsia sp.]|nr:hypothetical protein [Romboutsia sp.]
MKQNRRTGKTTRLIDNTIQILFNNKKIIIPSEYELKCSELVNDFMSPIIVDNEGHYVCQNYFQKKLFNRLFNEHHLVPNKPIQFDKWFSLHDFINISHLEKQMKLVICIGGDYLNRETILPYNVINTFFETYSKTKIGQKVIINYDSVEYKYYISFIKNENDVIF